MSVCRDFIYRQNLGAGTNEKLYNPQSNTNGDVNGDGVADIFDLVEQDLVLNGQNDKKTSADTDKNNILDVVLDPEALRKTIIKSK